MGNGMVSQTLTRQIYDCVTITGIRPKRSQCIRGNVLQGVELGRSWREGAVWRVRGLIARLGHCVQLVEVVPRMAARCWGYVNGGNKTKANSVLRGVRGRRQEIPLCMI